jgi:SAM-dependent methyltransferase
MKPEEDAYGQELLAYYNGNEINEIVERDDGFISTGLKISYYFSQFEDWPFHEQEAITFAKGNVLDIGCGAGRHALYLQEKGFGVLGIDNSPLAIRVCKLRGLNKAEVMSIEDIDFAPNSFDTILMLGNNFGLFGNFKKAQKLLRKFHKITSKNALIIADTRDPYKTENPDHLAYQEFNRKRRWMSGQIRLRIRFRKYATPWFDYLLVSKEEMKGILNGTRWKVKEFLDSGNANYVALIEKEMN